MYIYIYNDNNTHNNKHHHQTNNDDSDNGINDNNIIIISSNSSNISIHIDNNVIPATAGFHQSLGRGGALRGRRSAHPAGPAPARGDIRPISLLTESLLTLLDSNFPGNPLWT